MSRSRIHSASHCRQDLLDTGVQSKDIDDLILYAEGEYAMKKALREYSLDLIYPKLQET